FPRGAADGPKRYTGAVSMRLMPLSSAARIVAADSASSLPPHIHPPMAQVPSATRETLSDVPGISTRCMLISRVSDWRAMVLVLGKLSVPPGGSHRHGSPRTKRGEATGPKAVDISSSSAAIQRDLKSRSSCRCLDHYSVTHGRT